MAPNHLHIVLLSKGKETSRDAEVKEKNTRTEKEIEYRKEILTKKSEIKEYVNILMGES
jgi:hypothetical protein